MSYRSMFIEPKLKTIKSNRENAWSIKEMLLRRVDAPIWVTDDFHVFDGWYQFVHVKVDMLMEYQLSIKDESQVLPSIVGPKNVAF